MIGLLLEIKEVVEKHKIVGAGKLNHETIKLFEEKYVTIVEKGYAANPPPEEEIVRKRGRKTQSKAGNMLNRLSKHQHDVLAFMHNFNVPFNKN